MRPRVWNARRKMMGNLIPTLFWLPLTTVGVAIIHSTGQVLGLGFWIVLIGQITAIVALNYAGHWDNDSMRRQLKKELDVLKPHFRGYAMFVGYKSYGDRAGLLDPHMDVGFVVLTVDGFEFVGDRVMLAFKQEEVEHVEFRPNVHSLLGLGRWVLVSGRAGGKPFAHYFEPREMRTLLGNRWLSGVLKEKVENWKKPSGPPTLVED